MKKHLVLLAVVLSLTFGLTACQTASTPPADEDTGGNTVTPVIFPSYSWEASGNELGWANETAATDMGVTAAAWDGTKVSGSLKFSVQLDTGSADYGRGNVHGFLSQTVDVSTVSISAKVFCPAASAGLILKLYCQTGQTFDGYAASGDFVIASGDQDSWVTLSTTCASMTGVTKDLTKAVGLGVAVFHYAETPASPFVADFYLDDFALR